MLKSILRWAVDMRGISLMGCATVKENSTIKMEEVTTDNGNKIK
jgi:hypothetical protein